MEHETFGSCALDAETTTAVVGVAEARRGRMVCCLLQETRMDATAPTYKWKKRSTMQSAIQAISYGRLTLVRGRKRMLKKVNLRYGLLCRCLYVGIRCRRMTF